MMKTRFGIRSALLALATSVGLVACGGGGDAGTAAPAQAMGTLRVALTDAPNCRIGNEDLSKVFVTVERVRVHQSADAGETNGGWTDVVVSPPKKINLLELTNGRLEELGTVPIPAGTYTQVRLVLSPNQGNQTANSLVLVGGNAAEIPLRTPSAAQSGLKIIRPFTVQPNTLVDLVIDFDACRSIVALGNGGYLLKPTLTADLKTVAGIVGFVDPAVTNATVSAQKDGKVVRSTIPYATGEFVLAYLDPNNGPYVVVVTAPTRGTSVIPNVAVSTAAVTQLSTLAAPIPLPAAASPTATRAATGTLSPLAARDDGVIRALQTVGSAPEVEIATTNVDADLGTYTLLLPVAAPLLATYPATLPLNFATPASPPADFSYKLEATATGYVTQTNTSAPGNTPISWSPLLLPAP
jgi:Domain of unknown function (DUF4382)